MKAREIHDRFWSRAGRILRFGLLGSASNLLLLAFFAALFWWGLSAIAASMITYAVGVVGTYLFNRAWVFESTRRHSIAMPSYVVVHGCGAALTAALHWYFHGVLGFPALLVQVFAILLVAAFVFIALEWLIFHPKWNPRPAPIPGGSGEPVRD